MAMQKPLLLLTLLLATQAQGQTAVLGGGSMHVMEGTTLRFSGPLEFTLQPGATLVNDGVIDLGSAARLTEATGEPVRGMGVETARAEGSGPFTGITPGGLGLALTTTADGPLTITRGHLAQHFPEGDASIERWYHVEAPNAGGAAAEVVLHYDGTELNGLLASSLGLFNAPATEGPWALTTGTNDASAFTVSGTVGTPWGYITAFNADAPTPSPALFATGNLHVWPTLTTGMVYVHARDGSPLGPLQVYDQVGRSVPAAVRSQTGALATLDLSALASGPYYLRTNQGVTIKLRKE